MLCSGSVSSVGFNAIEGERDEGFTATACLTFQDSNTVWESSVYRKRAGVLGTIIGSQQTTYLNREKGRGFHE